RGFGADVKLPVLAKLMLAERFLPRLFDQIAAVAAAAPDGRCPELAALETTASARQDEKGGATPEKASARSGDAKAAPKLETIESADSALLGEWLSSPAIKAWAAVPTAIGGEDLRPYLFVAK